MYMNSSGSSEGETTSVVEVEHGEREENGVSYAAVVLKGCHEDTTHGTPNVQSDVDGTKVNKPSTSSVLPTPSKATTPNVSVERRNEEFVPYRGATRLSTSPPPADGRHKLFVGGLSWSTTDENLRAHFEQYGEIYEAVVIRDRHQCVSKGYGFVNFVNASSASEAIKNRNPLIDGRRANVNLATVGRKSRSHSHNNRQMSQPHHQVHHQYPNQYVYSDHYSQHHLGSFQQNVQATHTVHSQVPMVQTQAQPPHNQQYYAQMPYGYYGQPMQYPYYVQPGYYVNPQYMPMYSMPHQQPMMVQGENYVGTTDESGASSAMYTDQSHMSMVPPNDGGVSSSSSSTTSPLPATKVGDQQSDDVSLSTEFTNSLSLSPPQQHPQLPNKDYPASAPLETRRLTGNADVSQQESSNKK